MEEKELQEIRKRLAEIDVRLLETIMSPPEINSMIEELEDFKKKCKGEKIEKEVVIQYSEILVSKILVSGISVSKINEKPQLEDIEEIEEYVRKLGNLKEEYPEIEDIAINYAEGIDCYERVRDYKSKKIIWKAEELADCEDQSIEETEKRVEEIKGLKEKYQGEEKIKKEIVKCYAESLFYLTKNQDSAGAEENLRKLKNLKRIYQKEEKIKNYYVKA